MKRHIISLTEQNSPASLSDQHGPDKHGLDFPPGSLPGPNIIPGTIRACIWIEVTHLCAVLKCNTLYLCHGERKTLPPMKFTASYSVSV